MVAGVWTHVAIVFAPNAGTVNYYFDGEDAGSLMIPMDFLDVFQPEGLNSLTALGFSHGSIQFGGDLDEVRFWNGARTQQEVKDLSCALPTGSEGDLRLWWPFESDVNDHAAGANAYTAQGGAMLETY